MNVGVFLECKSPESGGGYSLQTDIFQSFVEIADESRHNFVVFCNYKQPKTQEVLKSRGIKKILYLSPNLIDRGVSILKREFSQFRKYWKRPSRLERIAYREGVEFMWFIDQRPVLVDLPYLTILLDLQHCLQPWFPEVSSKGGWDHRESAFSWFLRRASLIITGNEAGRAEIERFYQVPTERIKILPHPTPKFALNMPSSDGKEVLDKYDIPNGYLFYPAQFWPHKNHANLLLSVRKLRDEFKLAFPVVFVGSDKGNQRYIKKLVDQLDLSTQVFFLGFIPSNDLVSIYRNAFALTYVTFFGPENLPPLEAFALGCPVIASNVPGAKEQLGEAAILVNPKNTREIAFAIKSLYDDSELRRTLIQRGFNRAIKWTGQDFVRGVFSMLDDFESIRHCWGR